jgi:hypothetical protein
VQRAFIEVNECYNELKFADDDVFANLEHIDPGDIILHDWKKLRTIWKGVNADYKAALTNFTVSGTHDCDFYNFCHGKLDVYYLRKHLELKPELCNMVEADLPEECALASDMNAEDISKRAPDSDMSDSKQSSRSSKRKRKQSGSDIAEAIREFSKSQMRMEIANQKLRYLEKEDSRREVEHQQATHKSQFEEWERLQQNIRMLRQDMCKEWADSETREELKEDIDGLVKRKNNLAMELGLKQSTTYE